MITKFIYPLSVRERVNHLLDKSFHLKNFVEKNVSLEFNGKIKLDLSQSDVGHRSIILNGFYELELTKRIKALAKQGGLLIDVGANYGYFSCLWAAEQKKNTVLAFEANPSNVPALSFNVERNNLSSQVQITALALGNEKGRMSFYTGGETNQTGWGGLLLEEKKNSIYVEVDTLDSVSLQREIAIIDVLKIDTEGADTWILQGAVNLLKERRIKHIFYEANLERMKQLNINESDARKLLIDCGYKVELMSESEYYAWC